MCSEKAEGQVAVQQGRGREAISKMAAGTEGNGAYKAQPRAGAVGVERRGQCKEIKKDFYEADC